MSGISKHPFVAAFLLCCSMTVLSALGQNPNWHWLATSDINVGIWLFVAWLFGGAK